MPLHFKSKEAYRKYNAYRFIHNIPTSHKQVVTIAGKRYHVKHASVKHRKLVKKILDGYM